MDIYKVINFRRNLLNLIVPLVLVVTIFSLILAFGIKLFHILTFLNCLFALISIYIIYDLYSTSIDYISQNIRNHKSAYMDKRPYALLLRSFTNQDAYITNTSWNPGPSPHPVGRTESYIDVIDITLNKLGIALVTLKNHLKLRPNHEVLIIDCPDEDWFNNFQILSSSARIIIVLSEITEGISEEIDFVVSGELLKKTVFVMPPLSQLEKEVKKKPDYEAQINGEPRDHQWERAREFLEDRKIYLPSFKKQGGLFVLNNYGIEVLASSSLHSKCDKDSFLRAFKEILPILKGNWGQLHSTYTILRPQKKYKDYYGWSFDEAPGNSDSYFHVCALFLSYYMVFGIIVILLN